MWLPFHCHSCLSVLMWFVLTLCLVFSLEEGRSSSLVPPAPALLLAATLHHTWTRHRGDNRGFSPALNMLRPDRGEQCRQVRIHILLVSCRVVSCHHQDKTFLYMQKVRVGVMLPRWTVTVWHMIDCRFSLPQTSHHALVQTSESSEIIICSVHQSYLWSRLQYFYLLLSHFFFQVLVFLLSLCVNDYLSALLYPQVIVQASYCELKKSIVEQISGHFTFWDILWASGSRY